MQFILLIVITVFLVFSQVQSFQRRNPSDDNQRDPWQVLGLKKNSNEKAIKKAYKRLAKELHPDKNSDPNAHDKFIEVAKAYESITNENSDYNKELRSRRFMNDDDHQSEGHQFFHQGGGFAHPQHRTFIYRTPGGGFHFSSEQAQPNFQHQHFHQFFHEQFSHNEQQRQAPLTLYTALKHALESRFFNVYLLPFATFIILFLVIYWLLDFLFSDTKNKVEKKGASVIFNLFGSIMMFIFGCLICMVFIAHRERNPSSSTIISAYETVQMFIQPLILFGVSTFTIYLFLDAMWPETEVDIRKKAHDARVRAGQASVERNAAKFKTIQEPLILSDLSKELLDTTPQICIIALNSLTQQKLVAIQGKFSRDPIKFAKFEICTDHTNNDKDILAYASLKRGKRWSKFDGSDIESWILKILCGEINWIIDEEFPLYKKLALQCEYTDATTIQSEDG